MYRDIIGYMYRYIYVYTTCTYLYMYIHRYSHDISGRVDMREGFRVCSIDPPGSTPSPKPCTLHPGVDERRYGRDSMVYLFLGLIDLGLGC